MALCLSLHCSNDFPLHEHREALIEPEMFKVPIGHQVSSPRMRYFMSHYTCQRSVASLTKKEKWVHVMLHPCFFFSSYLILIIKKNFHFRCLLLDIVSCKLVKCFSNCKLQFIIYQVFRVQYLITKLTNYLIIELLSIIILCILPFLFCFW